MESLLCTVYTIQGYQSQTPIIILIKKIWIAPVKLNNYFKKNEHFLHISA